MGAGKDKQKRNDQSHDQKPDAAQEDDRGAEGDAASARNAKMQLVHDLKARVINMAVSGDRTAITLSIGAKQGVIQDMQGYIVSANGGMLAEFGVYKVDPTTSVAYVNLPPQAIADSGSVILNPSAKPAKVTAKETDAHARIINLQVNGGRATITIARGSAQGVQPGESGVVVDAGGKKIASFTVERVDDRNSYATVDATADQLNGANVILSPS